MDRVGVEEVGGVIRVILGVELGVKSSVRVRAAIVAIPAVSEPTTVISFLVE